MSPPFTKKRNWWSKILKQKMWIFLAEKGRMNSWLWITFFGIFFFSFGDEIWGETRVWNPPDFEKSSEIGQDFWNSGCFSFWPSVFWKKRFSTIFSIFLYKKESRSIFFFYKNYKKNSIESPEWNFFNSKTTYEKNSTFNDHSDSKCDINFFYEYFLWKFENSKIMKKWVK